MFCEELTNYLYGVLLGNSRAAILLVTMNLHTEKFDFPFERRCVLSHGGAPPPWTTARPSPLQSSALLSAQQRQLKALHGPPLRRGTTTLAEPSTTAEATAALARLAYPTPVRSG